MPTARSHFSTATNRLTLTGANYDNAGNQITTGLGETLAYDAENRLTSYTFSSSTTNYKYGPQGRRVQKVTPTATETYVYDAFGKLAAEYSTAAPTSGGTFYRTPDHLGSTRLVTKQDQSDADCYDYAPFGEEIPDTLGSRSSNNCFAASFDGRHRFTGKERDEESDLDYFLARYYSGPMGRFLNPDQMLVDQYPEDPQSWNLYGYVRNNPLRFVDPSGNACVQQADGTYDDDDSPGQTCEQVNRSQPQQEEFVYDTVPLYDLPGQFVVGFGEFFFNDDPQGAVVAANALTAGVLLQRLASLGRIAPIGGRFARTSQKGYRVFGSRLKNLRPMKKGSHRGFTRGDTELSGGDHAARSLFQQLTGRLPTNTRDTVDTAFGQVTYRSVERSKSGLPKIEISDRVQRFFEKITFK